MLNGAAPPSEADNQRAQSPFGGRLWLAPLTRGGHPAFRRLCVGFGAEVTVGEMAVARRLLQNRAAEFALLRSHPEEPFFGVQLADKSPESLAEAARLAEARGARFLDLNCGCPIPAITGRGLGASLLRRPTRLGRLVEAMRGAVKIPVTVKLRTGWSEKEGNVSALARVCEESGAAAITIHGRSREQRYERAADWDVIGRVAAERRVPVVGNGDILTHYEARDRRARSGATAIMVARGALIKPWIFDEIRRGEAWLPTPEERFSVLWRFVSFLREHFHDDERGHRRILHFLPWHLGFFCRYRPLPEDVFLEASRRHPLIQTRLPWDAPSSPLEALLRDPRPEFHEGLSRELLGSLSEAEALERALRLAETSRGRARTAETEALPESVVAG
jgi:tRNA-dihydrouridine synthase 3